MRIIRQIPSTITSQKAWGTCPRRRQRPDSITSIIRPCCRCGYRNWTIQSNTSSQYQSTSTRSTRDFNSRFRNKNHTTQTDVVLVTLLKIIFPKIRYCVYVELAFGTLQLLGQVLSKSVMSFGTLPRNKADNYIKKNNKCVTDHYIMCVFFCIT